MADNDPNKKDIQDARQALNDYNDSLRESISLARVLSDSVQSAAKKLGGVTAEDRKLIDTTKNLNKALVNSLGLTDKLYAGKLKQKDIDTQLNKLQETRARLEAESKEANSKIAQARSSQLNLESEILKKTAVYKKEEGFSEKYHTDLRKIGLELQKAENKELQARAAGNYAGIALAEKEQKELTKRLRSTELLSKEQDRTFANVEKELSELKKQKEEADKIVITYEELVKLIDDEVIKNKALNNALKEQNSLGGKSKKELKDIVESYKRQYETLTSITSVFTILKNLAFNVSEQATKIQKNLVLSRDEAYAVRQEFNEMATASGNVAINTNEIVAANAALSKQLGFSSKFTADLNVEFTKLTKLIGLSEEAAGGLARLSVATGTTLEESKNITLETSQRLSAQYGIQLNQREVLEEIGKISGQTLAMFKASPQALAQAVAQAKLLGTNLDVVRKQAASLLDFETSIENELQAELLTGQQLNLERARSASLAGDLITAMKELNNQNIDFNKFSQMNVIAQEKLANALGLSADELSDQLLKQQYLGKSQEEVVALAGKEVAERLEALSAQDKFNAAITKMQDLIGQLVGGPLGTLVDMFASLAENSLVLYGTLGLIAGLSFTKLIVGLAASAVQAGLLAAGTAATASAITLGIGAIAIAAGIATMMAAYNKAKEEATQPVGDMFSSNGKTVVSTKEGGLFELSNNDDFVAAPGIGDLISNANKQTIITQDNTETLNLLASIRDEMKNTNQGVNRLYSKEAKVSIGAQQVGTAQLMYNTNLA